MVSTNDSVTRMRRLTARMENMEENIKNAEMRSIGQSKA
jgi:hypothetical protein